MASITEADVLTKVQSYDIENMPTVNMTNSYISYLYNEFLNYTRQTEVPDNALDTLAIYTSRMIQLNALDNTETASLMEQLTKEFRCSIQQFSQVTAGINIV